MQNQQERRKFLSIGEWLTLIGMIAVAMSPGFTWQRDVPKLDLPSGLAMVVTRLARQDYSMRGFDLRIGSYNLGWIVVGLALICGSLLLITPKGREKAIFQGLQIVIAMSIVVLTVARSGFHLGFPGVIMSIVGSIILIWGAVTRYA